MKIYNNILFVSVNRHQRRYFRQLGEYLSQCGQFRVFYVHYAIDIADLFINRELPTGIEFTPEEIDEIIQFLLLKAKYRKFSLPRRFFYTRKVLTNKVYSAIQFFNRYIRDNNIDMVCVWNGTLIPLAVATRVAQKLGKKTLFFENGYLPGTTTVDPKGVNNRNSLVGKSRDFYDKVPIDYEKLKHIYAKPLEIRELKARWYNRILKINTKQMPEDIKLPERYIFLPFQVHDDTQILLHSPTIKTMEQLVNCVVPAVEQYNSKTGDDLWLVIKEHPSDFRRIDYSFIKNKYQNQKVIFLRYYPTPKLIQHAQGIITINSSVGIEGLVQHKPIITLGNAFYNVEGLVTHVSEPDKLADKIVVINQQVDAELIDKFLYYLRFFYLADGSWRQPDDKHFLSVERKIDSLFR